MISASLVKELREKTGAGMLDCKKALEANNGDINASVDWLREKGISKAAKKADRIAAEGLAAIKIDGNKAAVVEVNSETDFVAKNEEFVALVDEILNAVIKNNVNTVEEALELSTSEGTINDLIVAKTAKIGEKLSFRRFKVVEKQDNEVFGEYIHMGGKIAVLTIVSDVDESVAKDVPMHAAAMRPSYVRISDVPEEEVAKEKEILTEQAMNEGKPKEIAEKMVMGRINKFYKEICLEEQPFVKNNGGEIKDIIRF